MPFARVVRLAVVLTPTIALVGAGAWFLTRSPRPTAAGPAPAAKLVVLVVFDQLRGDYPERWAGEFGPAGFERIKREGVWYSNCHLPFACSSTGPGHAAIATGAPPAVNGIVENSWYVRGQDRPVYCASGDRLQRLVPPGGSDRGGDNGLSPAQLLVPGVGDVLRGATAGRGRVFALSLKDRGAVLLGGKDPTGAYCFDTEDGLFHTSTYYRDRVHPWVEAFNASAVADRWAGRVWERVGAKETYDRLAGPDDVSGEGTKPEDRVFPHPLPPASAIGRAYYRALELSPFGNELLWEFTKAAVVGERLGREDMPDLLMVSFSSNDLIGHIYGPDSHEVLDTTIRSDRLLGDMIAFFDERVGPGRYALVVTGDHGVCPLPESPTAPPGARRVGPGEITDGLEEALDEAFGRVDGAPGRWVEKDFRATFPWLYLNRRFIESHGTPYAEVERYVEQWLGNRPSVEAAYARRRLEGSAFPADDPGRAVQLAFHPDRCGDVYVLTKPYILPSWGGRTGTNHGTPHPYDTHVPVMAFGAGVPPLGRRTEPVSSLIVAPLLCRLLGIDPPTFAVEPLPVELHAGR